MSTGQPPVVRQSGKPYEADSGKAVSAISRLRLLADMYQELMVGRACPDAEVRALLTGHSEYLLFKKGKEVRIIT